MFPLDFPLRVLSSDESHEGWLLDPFCGRGTSNFAARSLGISTVGIDSNPVAVAISQAKLISSTPRAIIRTAERILEERSLPNDVPTGEFWSMAFHPETLQTLCRLREGLLRNCKSDSRRGLRALLLGALHGPRRASTPAYLSNQMQRTYAPKPRYAVRFWQDKKLAPIHTDVLSVVRERAHRYFGERNDRAEGHILLGDSRDSNTFRRLRAKEIVWIITSPPYYGMRTYQSDQWLRQWFLGGPPYVDYSAESQLSHASVNQFAYDLRRVWLNCGAISKPGARLVVRFGALNSRKIDPKHLIELSLAETGWEVEKFEDAGSAQSGRRQASSISKDPVSAISEIDVWSRWMP